MDDDILTLEQACTFLGVGERTLLKMLNEEHIPARKIGREWRFSKSALTNWVASGDSYEYAKKEELYEVFKDTNGNYEILLESISEEISNIRTNRNISVLLNDVPPGIEIPDNITFRVSYKQKREIEKLDFKLFWPLREDLKQITKENK